MWSAACDAIKNKKQTAAIKILNLHIFWLRLDVSYVDCSQSPIFPWVRRCRSSSSILVSWCERNWGEYKMLLDKGGGMGDSRVRQSIAECWLLQCQKVTFIISRLRPKMTSISVRRKMFWFWSSVCFLSWSLEGFVIKGKQKEACTAPQMIPKLDRKWSPMWTAGDPAGK